HPLLGAAWRASYTAPLAPRTKTDMRPSPLWPTAGLLVSSPPSDDQPDHPPFREVCQVCQSARSAPRAKTSIRRSWLSPTANLIFESSWTAISCSFLLLQVLGTPGTQYMTVHADGWFRRASAGGATIKIQPSAERYFSSFVAGWSLFAGRR